MSSVQTTIQAAEGVAQGNPVEGAPRKPYRAPVIKSLDLAETASGPIQPAAEVLDGAS